MVLGLLIRLCECILIRFLKCALIRFCECGLLALVLGLLIRFIGEQTVVLCVLLLFVECGLVCCLFVLFLDLLLLILLHAKRD